MKNFSFKSAFFSVLFLLGCSTAKDNRVTFEKFEIDLQLLRSLVESEGSKRTDCQWSTFNDDLTDIEEIGLKDASFYLERSKIKLHTGMRFFLIGFAPEKFCGKNIPDAALTVTLLQDGSDYRIIGFYLGME